MIPPKVILTRPRKKSEELAEKLAKMSVESIISPLLEIGFLPFPQAALAEAGGIIATSQHGVEGLLPSLSLAQRQALPLYVVGDATAQVARANGFLHVYVGPGTVEKLCEVIHAQYRSQAPLFYARGVDIAFPLKEALAALNIDVREEVVYQAYAVECLEGTVRSALSERAVSAIMFFSLRTAHIFSSLLEKHSLAKTVDSVTAFCLSSAIVQAFTPSLWKEIIFPSSPTTEALFHSFEEWMRREQYGKKSISS